MPGAERQALHHFLHDAPWDAKRSTGAGSQIWQAHPFLGPHAAGVLIVDETGDPKRGHRIELGGPAVSGQAGACGQRGGRGDQSLDGRQPACAAGRQTLSSSQPAAQGPERPDFHTKPALAWQLIEEARAAGIPFRLVVADSIYGENADLEAKLFAAQIPYIMGLRPSHGTWQFVEDPAHPPAFTPAEAAAAPAAWTPGSARCAATAMARSSCATSPSSSWGPPMGRPPAFAWSLPPSIPTQLKPESTWYLATSLSLAEVSAEQVYEIYRLRDWIEHYYKPVKHELGWADYQMRPERAIVRHWQLVMLAYTFSLLVGAPPLSREEVAAGKKIGTSQRLRVRGAGRERSTGKSRHLEPGAAPGTGMAVPLGSAAALLAQWSASAPPPELAALLAHLARSRPLDLHRPNLTNQR